MNFLYYFWVGIYCHEPHLYTHLDVLYNKKNPTSSGNISIVRHRTSLVTIPLLNFITIHLIQQKSFRENSNSWVYLGDRPNYLPFVTHNMPYKWNHWVSSKTKSEFIVAFNSFWISWCLHTIIEAKYLDTNLCRKSVSNTCNLVISNCGAVRTIE